MLIYVITTLETLRQESRKKVALNVKIEPALQKVSRNVKLTPRTTTEDNERFDVSTRGIYSSHELTFFDLRISNPNAPSNRSLTVTAVYSKNGSYHGYRL